MRYARVRMDQEDRRELYRVYVTESLRAMTGAGASYHVLAHGSAPADFDAEAVAESVVSRMTDG